MGDYRISKSWLTKRIESDDSDWLWAASQFGRDMQPGDGLWHFEEPASSGINAGAMGVALVRGGESIPIAIDAIH